MPREKQFQKKNVLDITATIFCEKGFHWATIEQISETTRLSRSSLYDTFHSKLGLFMAVLTYCRDREIKLLESIDKEGLTGLEKIRVMFENVIRLEKNQTPRFQTLLIQQVGNQNTTFKLASSYRNKWQQRCQEWLNQSEVKGKATFSHSTRNYTQFLFGTWVGMCAMKWQGTSSQELEQIAHVTLSTSTKI